MNKKFLPSWEPAELVAGNRTYIKVYADLKDGTPKHRFRKSFNLGRIKCPFRRQERADSLIEKINIWLKTGHYMEDFEERKVEIVIQNDKAEREEREVNNKNPLYKTNIIEALEKVKTLRTQSKRNNTNASFRSHINILIDYLRLKKMDKMQINQFVEKDIYAYIDWYKEERGVSNTTICNVISFQVTVWNDLRKRGFIEKNWWIKIRKPRKEKKVRRNFKPKEVAIVIAEIRATDLVLFYSLILEYACLIRPAEMRRLRFHDFYINEGLVVIPGDEAKNHKERIITIPDDFLRFFREDYWTKYPSDYFILGKAGKPNPDKAIGKNTLSARHKNVINRLEKKGLLSNTKGLQYYSWKDTGITETIDQIGLMAACDHAGHHDPRETMKYRHRKDINTKMKGFKSNAIREII